MIEAEIKALIFGVTWGLVLSSIYGIALFWEDIKEIFTWSRSPEKRGER